MPLGRVAQGGFTMLAVLALLFIAALGTQSVMSVISQQATREREELLLRVGEAYRKAIGDYYESSPGAVKQWPKTLDDLLEDRRFVGTRRHLRELYRDPVARADTWGIVQTSDGGIAGIYSTAVGTPIRDAARPVGDSGAEHARSYAEWKFVYKPIALQPLPREAR